MSINLIIVIICDRKLQWCTLSYSYYKLNSTIKITDEGVARLHLDLNHAPFPRAGFKSSCAYECTIRVCHHCACNIVRTSRAARTINALDFRRLLLVGRHFDLAAWHRPIKAALYVVTCIALANIIFKEHCGSDLPAHSRARARLRLHADFANAMHAHVEVICRARARTL